MTKRHRGGAFFPGHMTQLRRIGFGDAQQMDSGDVCKLARSFPDNSQQILIQPCQQRQTKRTGVASVQHILCVLSHFALVLRVR